MKIFDFPLASQAPRSLLAVDSPCGPLAVWGVLRYFKKRTATQRLLKACGHSRKQGTYTISLAVALHEHGVSVEFFTEPDPKPELIETIYYEWAAKLGITIKEPPELEALLSLISADCVPIFLYNTDNDIGHFSPLVGTQGDQVIMPYSDEKQMPKAELQGRWSAPGIFRQCILVRQQKPDTRSINP